VLNRKLSSVHGFSVDSLSDDAQAFWINPQKKQLAHQRIQQPVSIGLLY
jgi:hypothetical protein